MTQEDLTQCKVLQLFLLNLEKYLQIPPKGKGLTLHMDKAAESRMLGK